MITIKQGVDFFATIKTKKIYRNFESEFTITVINNGDSEILPKTLLFTDNYGCANFKVYLKQTIVPNGESEVTLIYDGIYKRDVCTEKEILLNGSESILKINCSGSGGGDNEKPIVQNKMVSLNNRTNLYFNNVGFTLGYYSPIASPLTEISFWGDISTITYNGLPYVANTFIPYADVVSGNVVHNAPNTDNAVNYGVYYSVKDAEGNVSDFALLNISNNVLGTIVWSNKFILVKDESGGFTRLFDVNYSGATGQQVTLGEIKHTEGGLNFFDISVNETKTLTGSGTLQFKMEGDVAGDGDYTISFSLFGTVNLSVTIIAPIAPPDPEPEV